MNKTKLKNELKELAREFGRPAGTERNRLQSLAKDAKTNQKSLRETVDGLRESLDYLRVCIKYQAFDLEATRRENEYLKRLLEEKDI